MLQTALHQAKYDRHSITNDPMKVVIHTLNNGMTLYMSVNPIEPRIFTNIAVRAGSKQDPADTTGLAHYMEHMLFKGTQKIGTINWEKEKKLLEKISDLYEEHRSTNDEDRKKAIYQEIDQVSQAAARFVVPNEYDNLATAIGASATNAYTWFDQTVYVNDIPNNELERWMELESERFSMMALRLFHTELETVYEEFNISQDKDIRKANNALHAALFPNHPYGTQTTLGTPENLKNPSQKKIQEYFHTYYIPNNMAIILSGDFDPDEVIGLAEKHFGHYPTTNIPDFIFEDQPKIDTPIRKEILGNEATFVEIGWRFGGSQTDDALMLSLIANLLHNNKCGLLDLNLNLQQRVLSSQSWVWTYQDYSILGLYARPKENQTLEEVEQLLLEQIELIRKGDFDESLLEAIITNDKLQETKALERNRSRTHLMTEAFILGIDWERIVSRYDWFKQQDKGSVVNFAREHLNDNHVVIYKRQGTDPNIVKVEKPKITPIELNKTEVSEFAQHFLTKQPQDLQPSFVDYQQAITRRFLANGLQLDYVSNPINDLFRLDFIFEMGTLNDRRFTLIDNYAELVGTSDYSASEIAMAFFKLGVKFNIHTYHRRIYITLQGLSSAFEESLQLLEHFIGNCQTDEQVMNNLADDIFTKRANAKKNKEVILKRAMRAFGRYGLESPFKYRLSDSEIKSISASAISSIITSLFSYEHSIYYYGTQSIDSVARKLEKHHKVNPSLTAISPPTEFISSVQKENRVYFTHFPMVQTELLLVSNGTSHFNYSELLFQDWYNEYFGSGLSSIIFQEIRESKGFAYACYAYAYSPKISQENHYLTAFLGTQPDKVADALPNMLDLLQNMPVVEKQMEGARLSQIKQIASERIKPTSLFWEAKASKDLGLHHDVRSDIYKRLQLSTSEDLINYHKNYILNRHYNIMILGDRNTLDFKFLEQFGPVEELRLEDIFGF